MTYAVKEIFYTLQGEGANAGRPAVFCRFAGCNLWSGREEDRASSLCRFCDTDFVGTDGENGGKFRTPEELVAKIASLWPAGEGNRFVVCTGGEPMLQIDQPFVDALHAAGFEIAIETNGSLPVLDTIDWVCVSPKADAPLVDALHAAGFEIAIETNGSLPVLESIDWICVSPKADAPLVVTKGNELKVVVPQENQRLADYAKLDFEYFLVQPMDGPSRDLNTKLAIDWCKRHPQWRLSMQTHKYLNIP